jgi:hypothetical protein
VLHPRPVTNPACRPRLRAVGISNVLPAAASRTLRRAAPPARLGRDHQASPAGNVRAPPPADPPRSTTRLPTARPDASPMASSTEGLEMLGGIFPAPNRFVALSDALAGSWTVLKAERSMTKRQPTSRCGFTPIRTPAWQPAGIVRRYPDPSPHLPRPWLIFPRPQPSSPRFGG